MILLIVPFLLPLGYPYRFSFMPRIIMQNTTVLPVADPGFPVEGDADLRCVRFSAKTCAKMKELDPVGGAAAPPGSANVDCLFY